MKEEITLGSLPLNFYIQPDEKWVDIRGYEGLYSVSNQGRVYSHYRKRCIKPLLTKKGYYQVHLSKNGKVKNMPIHRLVAMAFIPNPEGKPTVNHINEIKTDNKVTNLEWATNYEQNIHGTRIERAVAHTDWNARTKKIDYHKVAAKHNYYEINKNQMKPILQYSKDDVFIAQYDGVSQAARHLGIRPSHICCCLKGRRKTCAGFKWKYA